MKKAMPIGVDNFEELITNDYYYVDKTMFIKELIDLKGKVNLFTRPRRFGKTLNLSMLRYFFEDTGNGERNAENRELFTGMRIMSAGEEYTSQMGKYPVINLTLKSAKQNSFKSAYYKIKEEIAEEFDRHYALCQGNLLTNKEKERYRKIADGLAEIDEYSGALKFLSKCLYKATGEKVILWIFHWMEN